MGIRATTPAVTASTDAPDAAAWALSIWAMRAVEIRPGAKAGRRSLEDAETGHEVGDGEVGVGGHVRFEARGAKDRDRSFGHPQAVRAERATTDDDRHGSSVA